MALNSFRENSIKLSDDEIEKVLNDYSSYNRKRPISELSKKYASTLRRRANDIVEVWQNQGVPHNVWVNMKRHPDLVSKLQLKPEADTMRQSQNEVNE
jgi:hypothetical protein